MRRIVWIGCLGALLFGCRGDAPPERAAGARGAASPRAALRAWTRHVRAGAYVPAARLLTEDTRDTWVFHHVAVLDALAQVGSVPAGAETFERLVADTRGLVERLREEHHLETTDLGWLGLLPEPDRGEAVRDRFAAVPDRDRLWAEVFAFALSRGLIESVPLGEPELLFVRAGSATAYLQGRPHELAREEGRWFVSLSPPATETTASPAPDLPAGEAGD